jgi:RimJ/RimL family protein N-acetyltransferase
MLEGKKVNLRILEKEDLPLIAEWVNNLEFLGEYIFDQGEFIIEKKDGNKVGYIWHFSMMHPAAKLLEIGYFMVPKETAKGYCSEAAKIMGDYLFLSKDAVRIQAHTDCRNAASQKVLEKAGFRKEGTVSFFSTEENGETRICTVF